MQKQLMGITVAQWVAIGVISAVALGLLVAMRWIQGALVRRVMVRTYTADMIRRVLMAIIAFLAGIYILDVLEVEVRPLLGGLGISGLIVAVALQPLFANFVGSILLHGTRAFHPGDEITTNGVSGTVVDISHRAVELKDFDGNPLYVPNMRVLDSVMVNLTVDDPRRTLLEVQVAYGTDLRRAQRVLHRAISRLDGVAAEPPVQILAQGFDPSGVGLQVEIWHPAEDVIARRVVSDTVITIHETLAANDIIIPLPQVVLHRSDGGPVGPDGPTS